MVRTNIRCRLFAANVLLARGKREAKCSAAIGVGGFTDQPSRNLAHVLLACSDDPDVGPAVAGRNRKALQFADHDVGFAGRFDDAESHGFRKDNHQQCALRSGDAL